MSTPSSAWPDIWADLYDAMDVDRRPHLDFYCSLVTPDTQSLLDLGCGTGSITLAMAEGLPPGARVAGIDLSPRMVEICRSRAPRHEWAVGDIAAPPVTGPFDLVVICFHTLQAMLTDEDLQRCLDAVAGLMSAGGRFAFDIYRPNLAWLAGVTPDAAIARQFTDAQGRTVDVVETDGHYDPDTRILSGTWTLRDTATGAPIPVDPIVQRLRQYAPEDITAALARAGLAVDTVWGDLDRSPFAEGSKRQVYLCRKA
jgi:SAM-dependent methyltransferase